MEQPKPADGWPDGPLSEAEAADRLGADGLAVWVMDADSAVRSATVPADAPETPVVDIVIETDDAFEMYSYSGGRWMDYGTQRKDDEDAPPMAGTLESYRILTGESELDLG
jgi:hypothetical protein